MEGKFRKILSLVLTIVMIASLSVPALAASANLDEEVLSVTAITDSVIHSQKLKAMVVEYKDIVDPASLSLDSYDVQDLEEFGLEIKSATITAVYTNSEAAMTEDKQSVPGRFVVVEIDDNDGVGRVIGEYYYYTNAAGNPASQRLFPRPDDEIKPTVEQLLPIRYTNNIAVPEWGEKLERDELIHLIYQEFKDITLNRADLPGYLTTGAMPDTVQVKYYLPPSYGEDPDRLYPTVFIGCGNTLRYRVLQTINGPLDNHGAAVLTDQQATKWVNNPYEECIVVVPHYDSSLSVPQLGNTVNSVAEYFRDSGNFKVDPNRMYYSGNSYGALTGWKMLLERPQIWAGVMLNNCHNTQSDTDIIPAMDLKVPLMIQLGELDNLGNAAGGYRIYNGMVKYYQEKFGMTQKEIDEILQLNIYYADEYIDLNLVVVNEGSTPETRYKTDAPYYHAATKLIYATHTHEFMPWLFGKVKSAVSLSTDAHNVKAGDYFTMKTAFIQKQNSNAAILTYTFDGDKFEYANFAPADGVQVANVEYEAGKAKITVISMDYDLRNFGEVMLRAKEDAALTKEYQTVNLNVEYVLMDEAGNKTIETASTKASFTTLGRGEYGPAVPGDTNDDGVVDLIDLSNMIDWFGIDSTHPDWETIYTFFDFNNDGKIDVYDISYVAKLI